MASDAQQLAALLLENGRPHLKVRTEKGALIVHSVDDAGLPQTHLRFSPTAKGWTVAFHDAGTWRPSPIVGSLTEVVEALVSGGASRRAPPSRD